MIRTAIVLLSVVLLVGSLAGAGEEKANKKPPVEPYEGFKTDQALLRKHHLYKGRDGAKDTKASSGEACDAAQRIFSRVAFLFRTRAEVLECLGDPATISDYNQPAAKEPNSPFVYTFDSGFGGLRYTLRFGQLDAVRVIRVEVEGLD